MLDDRYYMRESSYRSGPSHAVILLVANICAFIVQLVVGYYSNFPILRYLALSPNGLAHGYIWQLFTFQFLHGGWLHVLLNCWVIYAFGRELEYQLGRKAFWTLYLSSGVFGGLLQVALGFSFGGVFSAPVVGASAGVFGLIAAYATISPERPITLLLFLIIPVSLRAKYLLLFSGIIAIVGVLVPGDNIAHAAHLGGMAAGIFFARKGFPWQWNLPRLHRRRPVLRVHSEKPTGWTRGPTLDPDDLPPEEFLSREVDPILEKISAQGIQSLTERERRILEKARSKMARR